MLKNEEMKQLLHASNILEAVIQYILNSETNDFYDKTGVTLIDIERSKKALIHIHSVQTVKKFEANQKANTYNKTHKEYHNIMVSLADARKKDDKQRIEYWQNRLKEYKGGK